MKKIYDRISIFSILMVISILFDYLLNMRFGQSVISYGVIFKYAVIICFAIGIFEGVQYLPIQNTVLIYAITSALITMETLFLECVIWKWIPFTFMNVCLLSIWIFLICGVITAGFIKKNRADARLINQRLEEWKAGNGDVSYPSDIE